MEYQSPGIYLLDVPFVARIFSVSPKTVYAWIRDGRIEAVRLPGGGLRVSVQKVADILKMDPAILVKALNLKPLL